MSNRTDNHIAIRWNCILLYLAVSSDMFDVFGKFFGRYYLCVSEQSVCKQTICQFIGVNFLNYQILL